MNKYILASSYPRQTFPDPNITIEGITNINLYYSNIIIEAKLFPQALLFIQEK